MMLCPVRRSEPRFLTASVVNCLGLSENEGMIHKILPVGPLQCNCSIIGDETTHEAMVIDPGDNIEDALAIVRQHKLDVKQIVTTHAHIAHFGRAIHLRAQSVSLIMTYQYDYT